MPSNERTRTLLAGLAYVGVFLFLDYISLIGLYRHLGISPWSPAAGLALAVAFFRWRDLWPFLYLAPIIGFLVIHPPPFGIALSVLLALVSPTIWLIAAAVMRRAEGFDPALRSMRAIAILIVCAALASAIDTFAYIGVMWVSGVITDSMLLPTSWRYVVGDLVGVLVVTPLILLVVVHRPWPRPHETHLAQLGLLVGALLLIFGLPEATQFQLFYLLFLPILWVALRDGVVGAVIAVNACQVGVVVGSYARVSFTPGLTALQTLMIVLVLTALVVGIVVTERQLVGQRLRDQQAGFNRAMRLRSAGETAAAIAHQMNQPLTAITTYASVAADALARKDLDAVAKPVAKIQAECDRAAEVLRSIRDLVKLGGLTRRPENLQALLAEVVGLHRVEAAAHRIELDLKVSPAVQVVNCDRVQVQQALYNLVNNSIEAISETERPGRISVAARAQGDAEVAIEVSDDGPGFAPGLESIATNPFMTTKLNGSGLGLAIARSVAEAHGGSLAIVSRGSGATVRLVLPSKIGLGGGIAA